MRFAYYGKSILRREKSKSEILAAELMSTKTNIPVPVQYGAGLVSLGPYSVYQYAEGMLLSKMLAGPDNEYHSILRPDTSEDELLRAYQAMADIHPELNSHSCPSIGSVSFNPGTWKVHNWPYTMNIDMLIRIANVPPTAFKLDSFTRVTEYFCNLAEH